jgi:hypothetical protein
VAFEIAGLQRESLIGANTLIVEGLDDGRKKTLEAETFALVSGESGTFIECRIVE